MPVVKQPDKATFAPATPDTPEIHTFHALVSAIVNYSFINQVALGRRQRGDLSVFQSSCHQPPFCHIRRRLHAVPYNAERRVRKLQMVIVLWSLV